MLTVRRLTKRFANGTTALREVDLDAGTGEMGAIVGGSGCGKSTLLRVVAGLERATSGEARLDGELIDGPHPKVGFVFQEPRLMPWLSVAGNVAFGLAHLPRPERERLVGSALHAVGLDRFAAALPRELSGGMAQRVGVARALALEPRVLLLDEPFGALDAITRGELQAMFGTLRRQTGVTTLLVTHDLHEARRLADRVAVMCQGRLDQVATPDTLVSAPSTPYVVSLVEKARLAGGAL